MSLILYTALTYSQYEKCKGIYIYFLPKASTNESDLVYNGAVVKFRDKSASIPHLFMTMYQDTMISQVDNLWNGNITFNY